MAQAYCYILKSCNPYNYEDIYNLCRSEILTNDIGKTVYINGDPSRVYRLEFMGGYCDCSEELPSYTVVGVNCNVAFDYEAYVLRNCESGEEIDVQLNQTGVYDGLDIVVVLNEIGGCWTIQGRGSSKEGFYTVKKFFNGCDDCREYMSRFYVLINCDNGEEKRVYLDSSIGIGEVIKVTQNNNCWRVVGNAEIVTEDWNLVSAFSNCIDCKDSDFYFVLSNCENGSYSYVKLSAIVPIGSIVSVYQNNNCWYVYDKSNFKNEDWTIKTFYSDCIDCLKFFRLRNCNTGEIRHIQIFGVNIGDFVTVNENNECWEVIGISEIKETTWTKKESFSTCQDCINSFYKYFVLQSCSTGQTKNVKIGNVNIGDVFTVNENNECWRVIDKTNVSDENMTKKDSFGNCQDCIDSLNKYFVLHNCNTGEKRKIELAGVNIGDVFTVNENNECWTAVNKTSTKEATWTKKDSFSNCQDCLNSFPVINAFQLENCTTGIKVNVWVDGVNVGDVITVNENNDCWKVIYWSEIYTEHWTLSQTFTNCTSCIDNQTGNISDYFILQNCETGLIETIEITGVQIGQVITVNENNYCWAVINKSNVKTDTWSKKNTYADCPTCINVDKKYFVLRNCNTGNIANVKIGNVNIGDVFTVNENNECWEAILKTDVATETWTKKDGYNNCQECKDATVLNGSYFEVQNCETGKIEKVEILGGLITVGDVFINNEEEACWRAIKQISYAIKTVTFKIKYDDCEECLSSLKNRYIVKSCCSDQTEAVRILGGAVNIGDVISVGESKFLWTVIDKTEQGNLDWTLTGYLPSCEYCSCCDNEKCFDGERTVAYASMVRLPEPQTPDKGFKECCYTNLVLADLNDADKYKNDFTGFYFKKQTSGDDCEFILHELKTGNTYDLNNSIYGDFRDFGSINGQPNLTTYIVRWRRVLQVLGSGLYAIEKSVTVAGLQFSIMSNTFTLEHYKNVTADKTVRIDAKMSGTMVHLGINFKNSDFETSIRTNGFFGRREPTYKQDNLVKRNYNTVQISMSQENEYEFQTNLIPECISSEIYDFILFGNEIFVSDYNVINHSYKYKLQAVELESNKGGKYYSTNRDVQLNLVFKDRIKNKRKVNC